MDHDEYDARLEFKSNSENIMLISMKLQPNV